jgi:hypothetical protein
METLEAYPQPACHNFCYLHPKQSTRHPSGRIQGGLPLASSDPVEFAKTKLIV